MNIKKSRESWITSKLRESGSWEWDSDQRGSRESKVRHTAAAA
jgi:hypothetical protein